MMMNFPGIRKECSRCYQLLNVMEINIKTNIQPVRYLGSHIAEFIQREPATTTIKSFCSGCMCEYSREYVEFNGQNRLLSESIYQDERMV